MSSSWDFKVEVSKVKEVMSQEGGATLSEIVALPIFSEYRKPFGHDRAVEAIRIVSLETGLILRPVFRAPVLSGSESSPVDPPFS